MRQEYIQSIHIPKALFELESAPFISDRDLEFYVSYKNPFRSFRRQTLVPVAKIISAPNVENWGRMKDYLRTDEYIADMANAMITGTLNLEETPPVLEEHGGAYLVEEGITRCALAKLLGMQYIPSDVTYIESPLTLETSSQDGYKTFLKRRRDGLWQGSLTTYRAPSRIPFLRRFIYARGEVSNYDGVWVFAKNVEEAKETYQKVGARGKPIGLASEPDLGYLWETHPKGNV